MRGRILIADDEPDIVSFIREYFESEDYDVLTAYDGLEAIRQIEKSPDIILLDIMMPCMDGIELCRTIRNFVDCPIIFLTARVGNEDKILGLGAGGDDYVVKPFSIEELNARVEAHLRRERRKMSKTRHVNFGRLYRFWHSWRPWYGRS